MGLLELLVSFDFTPRRKSAIRCVGLQHLDETLRERLMDLRLLIVFEVLKLL